MSGSLNVLIGIPGSGKSMLAQQMLEDHEIDLIISSDQIREELTGDMTSQERNDEVFRLLYQCVDDDLRDGMNVAVDATNLRADFREQLHQYARLYDVPAFAYILGDSHDFDVCQARNVARERVVPEDVMRTMHQRFKDECKLSILHNEGWHLIVISTRE